MKNQIREIITRAIIAKGKKKTIHNYTFDLDKIDKVLGCWITNHQSDGLLKQNKALVEGSYEVHIWYSLNNQKESALFKTVIEYDEILDTMKKDERDFNDQDTIKVKILKQPTCSKIHLNQKTIQIEIEKYLEVQVIGDTCIRVKAMEEDEMWLDDEFGHINENFIK